MQMDYLFVGRDGELVENEAALVTVLVLTDRVTGFPLALPIPRKGLEHSAHVLQAVELYLQNLGHDRTILQIDQENQIRSVAYAIRRHMGASRVRVRESPPRSHQSQGAVESMNKFIAGQVRTLLADIRARYPDEKLDVSHNLFPWMVRHSAWLTARFQVRTKDGQTPFRLANGVDYTQPIC